jgi:translation initiation factor 4A
MKTNDNDDDNDINEGIGRDDIVTYDSFEQMNLNMSLLRGVYGYGFNNPSPIQQKAIVPLTEGRDIIAQAQSGTGKTGAFSLGLLNSIDISSLVCQGLIIAPTRELAGQIGKVVSDIGYDMNVKCHICIGGTDWREDVRILEGGVHVVVGTPGRVYDMLRRYAIDGRKIKCVILDEADELLKKEGFMDLIYDIFQELDKNVQIGLFSATIPPEVLTLTKKFMKNPSKIIVKAENLTLEGIRQFYIDIQKEEWKFDTLCDLYNDISVSTSIIFCRTKKIAQWLANNMRKNDFSVTVVYGGLDQVERDRITNEFRAGKSRVLITTDLMARGIDIQHVSIVINYDLPKEIELYLHRVGRSGRFGRKGLAINFTTKDDIKTLHDIEKFYNTQIEEFSLDCFKLI